MAKAKKMKQKYPVLQRLKGKLLEHSITYEDACAVLGLTIARFCLKINGYAFFTAPEIRALADLLMIEDTDIAGYFIPSGKAFKEARRVA